MGSIISVLATIQTSDSIQRLMPEIGLDDLASLLQD